MKLAIAQAGLVVMLFSGTAVAKGVSIDPGLWEMTVTVAMPMLPQPQADTSTECITETELNPEDFNQDEDMPCDIGNVVINGNSANWTISCPNPSGPPMSGRWEFTSKGSSITGSGSMSMDMGDQKMVMDMTWTGHRIGNCD